MDRTTKAEFRRTVLAARRLTSPEQRRAEADALREHLPALVCAGQTVCAYVPVGSEPGSPAMLDALVALGTRVLLPVAREDEAGVPQPLQWGEYRSDTLVDAPFSLREPAQPFLDAETVAAAAVILVPALAVDLAGVRLGRGAGFYDRSLGWADPAAKLVAVVRDDELVDWLPGEEHDVRMTHALTPARGLVTLGEGD
ncbi:5-formyltetrahydrofolate cyclo-ligase [Mycobacterium sp. URHB0044]|uniref:5-formyltetrahydrofolate cyclo-ligase n=1 Tax=Mycobacterium sp. URHB0044 TaxID=1380386 RepID=UPI00056C1C5E|nr:5-formyltetrahydrofolate cyclo-ligase [Mycobacterium sp. URHB0044]